MRNSYMSSKQADQVLWSQTFVNVVGPAKEAYGVADALMTHFLQVNNTLQAAWSLASEPMTRTRGTIAAKNDALKAMKDAARNLVSIIQGTPDVTDQMKIDAGLTVRDRKPTPTPVPDTSPVIVVTRVDGRSVTIELRQSKSKRGKPAKVAGATVFTHMGPTPPQEDQDWKFAANTTRTSVHLPFGPSETGDTVWITAFWKNSRDESGPAAQPMSVNLPAGSKLPSEVNEAPKAQAA